MENTNQRYDWQGLIIATIFIIFGISIIYFTWNNMPLSWANFCDYFSREGISLIFGLAFLGIGLVCWKIYIYNVIIKPKKEILYLKNEEEGVYTFLDSKGKKFFYTPANYRKLITDKYYAVMKTKDNINKILQLSNAKFPIRKEKISFWLNFYTPFQNFENIFYLLLLLANK